MKHERNVNKQTAEILASVPLFEELRPKQIELLAGRTVPRTFDTNAMIVLAGDLGDSMMVILEGQVKVLLTSSEGKEIILSHMFPGDFFGEMSLIDPAPRSASVFAVEPTKVAVLSRDVFVRTAEQNPDVLMEMTATMCRRLRQANEKIADLAFRDVAGRVANYLVELAVETGEREADSPQLVRVRIPSHKEIAALLGTTRETVSRVFTQFRDAEFIIGESKCWLVDPEKLGRVIER